MSAQEDMGLLVRDMMNEIYYQANRSFEKSVDRNLAVYAKEKERINKLSNLQGGMTESQMKRLQKFEESRKKTESEMFELRSQKVSQRQNGLKATVMVPRLTYRLVTKINKDGSVRVVRKYLKDWKPSHIDDMTNNVNDPNYINRIVVRAVRRVMSVSGIKDYKIIGGKGL